MRRAALSRCSPLWLLTETLALRHLFGVRRQCSEARVVLADLPRPSPRGSLALASAPAAAIYRVCLCHINVNVNATLEENNLHSLHLILMH